MRVALLTPTFSRNMGYLENMLPRYLARAGAETHVIAMDLPPYYWMPDGDTIYGTFSQNSPAGTVEALDGFTLHILAHKKVAGYMRMVGLGKKLAEIRPDIVQCSAVIGWIPMDAAIYRNRFGYRLFSGNHYHASVFPLANKSLPWWHFERLKCKLTRGLTGWTASLLTEKCYAIAPDCARVASQFFGVPSRKITVCSLGVDTELFHPVVTEADRKARCTLRGKLGFSDSDIVCIYSGRLSEDKNPLLLARAVAQLSREGRSFRALVVGNGPQLEAIQACPGSRTHAFVPVHELGEFFRAADIGVWPAQESLSMLDAAACGLPIIANDTMSAKERIDGNGFVYRLGDPDDLMRVLLQLERSSVRQEMGRLGARKVELHFSWQSIAMNRLEDYRIALEQRPPKKPRSFPGKTYLAEKPLENGGERP